jgi:hypothetical protein
VDLAVPRNIGGLCFLCSNKVEAGHIRHLDPKKKSQVEKLLAQLEALIKTE